MPSVTHGIQWACRVIALTLGLRHQRVVQRDVILAEAASLARSMLPDFLARDRKALCLRKTGAGERTLSSSITFKLHLVAQPVGKRKE